MPQQGSRFKNARHVTRLAKMPRQGWTDLEWPKWPQIGHRERLFLFGCQPKLWHHLERAEFKDYIRDPKAKIPNTKMTFAGIK